MDYQDLVKWLKECERDVLKCDKHRISEMANNREQIALYKSHIKDFIKVKRVSNDIDSFHEYYLMRMIRENILDEYCSLDKEDLASAFNFATYKIKMFYERNDFSF